MTDLDESRSATTLVADGPAASATRRLQLGVSGMTCSSCAARVEKKLNRLPGVRASVNYATGKATVDATGPVTDPELCAAVTAAGYGATPVGRDAPVILDPEAADTRRLWLRLIVALILFVPLSDLSLLFALLPASRFPGWQLVLTVVALPVVTWCAWPFHRAAARNLIHGTTTMDTLVSAGVIVSTLWSWWAMLGLHRSDELPRGLWAALTASGSIYLETAAGITTFVLAGRYLETKARGRSGGALRALAALAAKDATVLLTDGTAMMLPITELKTGQRFLTRPGERIATDGVVETGPAAVDTSAMTGESIPQEKTAGDRVIGGTLVTRGRLVITAGAVGQDTALAGMLRLVESAQTGKAAVQRRVDAIAAVFVPVVLLIAVGTLIGWLFINGSVDRSVNAALGVLVIACPCALGLATPTALLVASGRGAQWGIFLKGHRALEATRQVDTVVLDKTGTVTIGAPRVHTVLDLGSDNDNAGDDAGDRVPAGGSRAWLADAAAVEASSEHAIAAAIVRAAEPDHAGGSPAAEQVTDFENLPGLGARATVAGRAVVVGRRLLFDQLRITVPAGAVQRELELSATGSTVVLVAVDGVVRGLLALADPVKESAAAAVAALHRQGLRTVLLTGDSPGAAHAVAAQIGVTEVVAGVLPAGKVEYLRSLAGQGHRVAMVGDGINDGPALATADLGMAIGSGTDVAIAAADIVLVCDDLRAVPDTITLAAATLSTIRGNLRWALGYNVAAIPIAVAGLAQPLLASAAMALSSLFVVSNSLRLAKLKSITSTPDRVSVAAR